MIQGTNPGGLLWRRRHRQKPSSQMGPNRRKRHPSLCILNHTAEPFSLPNSNSRRSCCRYNHSKRNANFYPCTSGNMPKSKNIFLCAMNIFTLELSMSRASSLCLKCTPSIPVGGFGKLILHQNVRNKLCSSGFSRGIDCRGDTHYWNYGVCMLHQTLFFVFYLRCVVLQPFKHSHVVIAYPQDALSWPI